VKLQKNKPRIGLVCSGGGARSFFHLGFLEQLSLRGVRPESFDCLCGVSGGALALYPFACAADMSEVVRSAKRKFAVSACLSRLPGARTWHMFGLLRRTLRKELGRMVPTRPLENLPAKLLIMSFDVVSGKPFFHSQGDALEAISSSMAIPFFSSPVRLGNRLLIDGGAWSSLPAAELRNIADLQHLVGVDVSGVTHSLEPTSTKMGPVGMALRAWESQRRSLELQQRRACTLLIRPDISGFQFSNFTSSAIEELLRLGRKSAEAALPQIKAVLGQRQSSVKSQLESIECYSVSRTRHTWRHCASTNNCRFQPPLNSEGAF